MVILYNPTTIRANLGKTFNRRYKNHNPLSRRLNSRQLTSSNRQFLESLGFKVRK